MKGLIFSLVVAFVFSLSPSMVYAKDICAGNFDYDEDVDGKDAFVFKKDFGRSKIKNPCKKCPPPTRVPKTGQTRCYDEAGYIISCEGTGQDGEYQKGVEWPIPRFTDNLDGTLTDNLTGLIWLKKAHCFGGYGRKWIDALSVCSELASGQCGLTDGSSPGDWRLPNIKELQSLTTTNCWIPAVPNIEGTGCGIYGVGNHQLIGGDPFSGLQQGFYWSSTTNVSSPGRAWYVWTNKIVVDTEDKQRQLFVLPVRDQL